MNYFSILLMSKLIFQTIYFFLQLFDFSTLLSGILTVVFYKFVDVFFLSCNGAPQSRIDSLEFLDLESLELSYLQ
jgi:hypothetical protein